MAHELENSQTVTINDVFVGIGQIGLKLLKLFVDILRRGIFINRFLWAVKLFTPD